MTLFILFIFGVYGGVHAYAFLKARQAFGFGWGAGIVVAFFMAFMGGAVFLILLVASWIFVTLVTLNGMG